MWRGLRTTDEQAFLDLRDSYDDTMERVSKKRKSLRDVSMQYVALRSLMTRNGQDRDSKNPEQKDSSQARTAMDHLKIPFVVVGCSANTRVEAKACL